MSPLGQKMAEWLYTKPGMFRGDTESEVLAAAYEAAAPRMKGVSFEDFCDVLYRVGYSPSQRTAHGDGGRKTFWVLGLPEAT